MSCSCGSNCSCGSGCNCGSGKKNMYLDEPIPTELSLMAGIAAPVKVSCMYSFKARMATTKYVCKHGGGAEEGIMAHAAAEGIMGHAAAEGFMAHAAAEGIMAHAAAEGIMAHAAAEGIMAHAAAERAGIM